MGIWQAPTRSRRYAPLADVAKYPAEARPSKCIIIIFDRLPRGTKVAYEVADQIPWPYLGTAKVADQIPREVEGSLQGTDQKYRVFRGI
jgi:hypothetical protein